MMTWGSHCPNCGKDDCGWADGPMCEGLIGINRPRLGIVKRILRWLRLS